MKKGCELCGGAARMYCESDQASLCWDCDEKVHGANFLVAKHCRSLLCQVCQSPTPWKASGPKLSHTVSICESCVSVHNCKIGEEHRKESQENDVGDENGYDLVDDDGDSDGYSDSEDEDDDEEEEEEEEEVDQEEEVEEVEEDEEDGDNQVVPWSGTAVSSPLPPTASSSSCEEDICGRFPGGGGVLKRRRGISADLDSDDEIGCFSSRLAYGPYGSSCERLSSEEGRVSLGGGGFRPLKQARISEIKEHHKDDDYHYDDGGQEESRRSTAIIDSIKRLQRGVVVNNGEDNNASAATTATVLEICRLSRDQSR